MVYMMIWINLIIDHINLIYNKILSQLYLFDANHSITIFNIIVIGFDKVLINIPFSILQIFKSKY